MFNLKFTPEAFFIVPPALLLDLCGLGLVIFGLDDLGILDITGVIIFFPWLLIRGKKLPSLSGSKNSKKIKKFFTNKNVRFLTPLIGEVTPWLGGIGFFWTMTVLSNLEEE